MFSHLSKHNRIRLFFALMALALILGTGWVTGPSFVSPSVAVRTSSAQPGYYSPAGAAPIAGTGIGTGSQPANNGTSGGVIVGHSVKNDVSPPLRDIRPLPPAKDARAPENDDVIRASTGGAKI